MAFTHVLVPTDFSDPSTHALRHAIAEARLHRGKVTLLHVLPARSGAAVYYVIGAPEAGPQGGFDVITGGPPGAHLSSESTVLLRDPNEPAHTIRTEESWLPLRCGTVSPPQTTGTVAGAYECTSSVTGLVGSPRRRFEKSKRMSKSRGEEGEMAIEYLLVTYPEQRAVLADGKGVGFTNHTLMLPSDEYLITLEGTGYRPSSQDIGLSGTSIVRPMVISFSPISPTAGAPRPPKAAAVSARRAARTKRRNA